MGTRTVDIALAVFFAMNVPLVLLIDSTAVFPLSKYPVVIQDTINWHIHNSGDYLMRDKPAFFMGLVYCEIFLQLPLYLVNAYAFFYGKSWGRTTGIIYGVHTATTMVPILFDILCSNIATKSVLFAIYLPYLVIPLAVLARLLPDPNPFGQVTTKKRIE